MHSFYFPVQQSPVSFMYVIFPMTTFLQWFSSLKCFRITLILLCGWGLYLCATVHVWRSQGNLQKSVFLCQYRVPGITLSFTGLATVSLPAESSHRPSQLFSCLHYPFFQIVNIGTILIFVASYHFYWSVCFFQTFVFSPAMCGLHLSYLLSLYPKKNMIVSHETILIYKSIMNQKHPNIIVKTAFCILF